MGTDMLFSGHQHYPSPGPHNAVNRWGIILAGGNGARVSSFTEQCYTDGRPKQFCAFVGTRSMLQHTVDRAALCIERERLITVVSGKHLPFVRDQFRDGDGTLLVQPYSRETAASILLPLSAIHHQDPSSVTAIFPSDHFILDEWKFSRDVRLAAEIVRERPDTILLLGVRPDREEHGYGWIELGSADREHHGLYTVRSFAEKPSRGTSGTYLWNSFVVIARTSTLMRTVQRCVPELHSAFLQYRRMHGTHESWHTLNTIYERLPSVNFSSAVLEKVASHLSVLDISDVGWNDWGEERRIREDAERYDLRLNLPVTEENVMATAAA